MILHMESREWKVRSTRDDLQSMRSWVSRALQVEKNKHASESRTLIKKVNHDLKKMSANACFRFGAAVLQIPHVLERKWREA